MSEAKSLFFSLSSIWHTEGTQEILLERIKEPEVSEKVVGEEIISEMKVKHLSGSRKAQVSDYNFLPGAKEDKFNVVRVW